MMILHKILSKLKHNFGQFNCSNLWCKSPLSRGNIGGNFVVNDGFLWANQLALYDSSMEHNSVNKLVDLLPKSVYNQGKCCFALFGSNLHQFPFNLVASSSNFAIEGVISVKEAYALPSVYAPITSNFWCVHIKIKLISGGNLEAITWVHYKFHPLRLMLNFWHWVVNFVAPIFP